MTGKKHDQKSISRDSLEVNSVDSLESNDNSDDSIQVLNDSLGKDIFYKVFLIWYFIENLNSVNDIDNSYIQILDEDLEKA